MIPRLVVPYEIRPPGNFRGFAPGKRLYSALDRRITIPLDMPAMASDGRALDGHTSIPSFVPLDVLAARTLIQRGMPVKPFGEIKEMPAYLPLDVLVSPMVVPRDVEPAPPIEVLLAEHKEAGPLPPQLLELREPDVLTTGEVTFLPERTERQRDRWEAPAQIISIGFHVLLLLLVVISPKMFQGNQQVAEVQPQQQLNYLYLPPSAKEAPKVPERKQPPSPRIRVDPRELRRLAPPNPSPTLPPGPVPRPDFPAGSSQPESPSPTEPSPRPAQPSQPQPSISNLNAQPRQPAPRPRTGSGLTLPNLSPGSAIQQSLRQALQGGGKSYSTGDTLPQGPGGAGGGGAPTLGEGLQMLTPDDGVDFTNYFQRLLASVKRNWYAVIPESARMGDKGKVVIQFRIQTNGTVPYPEPNLVRSSGKEPLDRAAMAAISASSPFEPLPTAYTRPYIELRFTFLYNLPLGAQ